MLYKFEVLEQYHEVRHFVTGRTGGFSEGNYKGLNLGTVYSKLRSVTCAVLVPVYRNNRYSL